MRDSRAPGGKESYCYARRIARRFGKTKAERNFEPTFHPERQYEPSLRRKPVTIFMGSMTDLFGPWAPDEWIWTVLQEVVSCRRHVFLLLTKYPERYKEFNPWPSNCWLGASATNGTTWWAGQHHLSRVEWEDGKRRSFISLEPLLGPVVSMEGCPAPPVQWLIVGAQTPGRFILVTRERMGDAWGYAQTHSIPLFIKDSLYVEGMPRDLPYLEVP